MPVPRRTYLIAAGGFLLLAAVLFWAVVRVGPAEEGDSREAAASVEGEAGSADAAPTDTASEQVVYGTVTSVDEGLPVGDAVIGFVEGGDAMSNAAEAADGVRSDDSGAYEVALPADAGGMAVQCSARGFVRETRPIPDGEGRVRLDFLLYRSAYVGGTVTDVDTLAPVAGVTVCLLDARANVLQLMRQQNRLQAITDAAGTYGFDGVPAGPYRAVVHPKAAGYLFQSEQARHLEVQAKSVYDDVDFALAAGGAVTGIVLDEQGEPVEGAQVLVLPTGLVQTFMNRLSTLDVSPVEDYVTRTEPDGTFRVPGLDHDVEFRVRAEAKGYAWTVSDPFVTNRAAPEAKVRLILPRGCSVSGRLMHDDGTPAANRRVMMTWAGTVDSVAMTARPYSSTSGEDGSFVLEHITAGEYALRARGSAPRLLEVDGTTDVTGIEMSVGPREIPGTEVIAGTVVDASGSSVADVRVQALRGRRRSSRSVTGSDGSFELGGLRAGRYDVIARCDAGRAEQSAVATGDTVTLALIAPGRVAGMVVDMAGDPAGKCSVALKGTEDGEGPETIESLFRDVFGQEAAAKTVTDAFGVFEFEEVWPGEYTVKAKSGEGGSGASGTFQVAAGAEKLDLRIVLADGVRVAGVVVDKRGLPVAGALVQLSEAGDADPVRQLVVQVMVPGMRRTSGTAVTDDAGEFRIDGVMPGGYDLTATHRAYAQKIVRGLTVGSTDTARQRVVLSDPSQAEGRFTVKGEPRPGAMVMFFGPSGLHIASTDSEGRFEVNGLSPGAYVAKGFDPAGLALMEGMDFSGVDLSIDVVDVANGEDVDLDLGTGGGTPVQGTLQGVGGDAVTWVVLRRPDMAFPSPVDAGDVSGWIDALRGVGGQGFVAEDGSFDVGEVEPGNYVVEVYSVDFSEGPPEIGNLMGLLEQPMLQQNVEIGSEPVTLTLGVPGATAPEE